MTIMKNGMPIYYQIGIIRKEHSMQKIDKKKTTNSRKITEQWKGIFIGTWSKRMLKMHLYQRAKQCGDKTIQHSITVRRISDLRKIKNKNKSNT